MIAEWLPGIGSSVDVMVMSSTSSGFQPILELRERQRARDASDVAATVGPFFGGKAIVRHDVADADSTTRAQNAMHLGEHLGLIDRQGDDAVGDDHIDGAGRDGDVLDVALEELDVLRTGLVTVADRQGKHLLGHIEAVHLPGRADPLCREQRVDATARPEIENRLSFVEFGDGNRVPAAEARHDRCFRKVFALERLVQLGTELVSLVCARRAWMTAIAGGALAARNAGRHLRVAHTDLFAELSVVGHLAASFVANTSASRSSPSLLSE